MNIKNLSKKALILLAGAFLFSGCYTRLMTYQGEVTADGKSVDTSGCSDCRAEVAPTGSREVCVWERDMFGYPDLRCYYTGYSSSWLYFHNTPWWYRSSYGWYDSRGCPAYYYYDRGTGRCRYYGGSYPGPNNGMGGGGGGGAVGSRPRPQARGITPGAAAAATEPTPAAGEYAPMFSGGANKTLSPVGSPSLSGSGSAGMSKPAAEAPAEQKPPAQRPLGEGGDRPQPPARGIVKPQGGGSGQTPPPVVEQNAQEQKSNDQNERPRPSRGR